MTMSNDNQVLCTKYIIVDKNLSPMTPDVYPSREYAANILGELIKLWKTARVVQVDALLLNESETRLARE